MGAGFDCMGIALTMRNTVEMELSDTVDIVNELGYDVSCDETNLIYKCAKRVFDIVGKPLPGLKITERSVIPMTRGLGSSSACTVAGVVGANELLGKPLDTGEIIDLAACIEGHPDNTTPAIRGGFVAALLQEGKVWQVRVPISHKLRFCAFIPDFELKTEKARGVLPQTVPFGDAVFNLSRAALFAGSLVAGDLHNMIVATEDCLHQPYRFDLIEDGKKVIEQAKSIGALGAYISGAGPTIMAIVDREDTGFEIRAKVRFSEMLPKWKPVMLDCDETGVTVERVD
jgi:homoserine kinase